MISVINQDYPRLDTYLCFECGFHADTILMGQRSLYQGYQRLFPKFTEIMKLKNFSIRPSDETLQQDKKGRNPTETGQNLCSHKTKISLVISLVI